MTFAASRPIVLMCVAWLVLVSRVGGETPAPGPGATSSLVLSRLAFEVNLGQFNRSVRFAFRGPGYTAFFLDDRVTMIFPAKDASLSSLSMRLKGATHNSKWEGLDALPVRSSYWRGRDPRRWVGGAQHYARLRYRNIYPGVDLIFRQTADRGLEYDWVVAPGGDPAAIRVTFDKRAQLRLDRDGDLVVRRDGLEWLHRRPVAYQAGGRQPRMVDACFRIRAHNEAAVQLPRYDRDASLVIDPVLVFSLEFGGPQTGFPMADDSGSSVAVGPSGLVYVAGNAISLDFPRAQLKFGVHQLGSDAFLAEVALTASGDFSGMSVYFLGGSSDDSATGVAVDSQANVYVTGTTNSPDFPLVNAMQTLNGGGFAAKFSADFSRLIYSTYLGGMPQGIAVDSAGSAFITGQTGGGFFNPTAGAFQSKTVANGTGFVTKLDTSGKLVYATFLGGSVSDFTSAITVDAASNAYITGYTLSRDFPVTPGVVEPTCVVCHGAFVTELNATGTALVFSTYLGAESWSNGTGIALDAAGNIYITGGTLTPARTPGVANFPTTQGAFLRTTNAAGAAFITKLNSTASTLVYSTLLAGPSSGANYDDGSGATSIAVDSAGSAYVTGLTSQLDFPLVQPLQAAFGGPVANTSTGQGICAFGTPSNPGAGQCTDAFVAKLLPDGSGLEWSTLFGGTQNEFGNAIIVSMADVYVTGQTESSDFPVSVEVCPGSVVCGFFLVSPGTVFLLKISQSAAAAGVTAAGVTSAASYVTGLAPGSLSSVFGVGFTSTPGVQLASLPLPTELGGVSVLVNGEAAPLLAVSSQQINFVAPWDIPPPELSRVSVSVIVNGVASIPVEVPTSGYLPAAYLIDGVHVAAQHSSDYSLVTTSNPARPGEVIVLYADGLGLVQPPVQAGTSAPANPPSTTVVNPVVTIGGAGAAVLFSGLAPGLVNLYQLNIRLPLAVAQGDQDVLITVLTEQGLVASKPAKLPISP